MSHEDTRFTYKPRVLALIALLFAATLPLSGQEPEGSVTGTLEVGNRWRWLTGNEDLYRSTINLGRGPKLNAFSLNATIQNPDRRPLVDRFTIRTTGWGGEPYSTTQIRAGLGESYDVRFNYGHFDYFNSVPSFANPTAARTGATQSTLDIGRRLVDGRLTIRPNAAVSPFIAYELDSSRGPGRTNFVQDANEYVVATNVDNATNSFRGGVTLKFSRWSGGVEAGGSWFHDDQNVDVSGASAGNRATLFLGQRLELTSLKQKYNVSGRDRFARSYGEFRPWRKLSLNGQFSYSRPTTRADYSDAGSGKLVLQETLQYFTGEQTLTRSEARYPHPSGTFGAEFRPTDRIRIVETLSSERYRIAGSADLTQTFTPTSALSESDSSSLKASLTRQRLDAIVDLSSFASVHAGHSYTVATATTPGSILAESETRDVHRNQADIGVAMRFRQRLKINVDYREDRGDATFFRTDTRQLRRLQLRGRYQISEGLQFGAGTSIWNNDNEASDINFFERSRETSGDVTFAPKSGKWFSLFAGYTRGTFRSDLPFLVPQNYQTERSIYRDRGHSGSFSLTLHPQPRIQAGLGGSFFVSTGTGDDGTENRPTRFYNPRASLSFKLNEAASFVGEWNWHAYSNRAFLREAYRAHLLMTGIEYRF